MAEPYHPVSCSFYDQLEAFATLRTSCEIVFVQSYSRSVVRGKVINLYTRDKVEYLKMDTGLEIRLDHIVQINGIQPANMC